MNVLHITSYDWRPVISSPLAFTFHPPPYWRFRTVRTMLRILTQKVVSGIPFLQSYITELNTNNIAGPFQFIILLKLVVFNIKVQDKSIYGIYIYIYKHFYALHSSKRDYLNYWLIFYNLWFSWSSGLWQCISRSDFRFILF